MSISSKSGFSPIESDIPDTSPAIGVFGYFLTAAQMREALTMTPEVAKNYISKGKKVKDCNCDLYGPKKQPWVGMWFEVEYTDIELRILSTSLECWVDWGVLPVFTFTPLSEKTLELRAKVPTTRSDILKFVKKLF